MEADNKVKDSTSNYTTPSTCQSGLCLLIKRQAASRHSPSGGQWTIRIQLWPYGGHSTGYRRSRLLNRCKEQTTSSIDIHAFTSSLDSVRGIKRWEKDDDDDINTGTTQHSCCPRHLVPRLPFLSLILFSRENRENEGEPPYTTQQ